MAEFGLVAGAGFELLEHHSAGIFLPGLAVGRLGGDRVAEGKNWNEDSFVRSEPERDVRRRRQVGLDSRDIEELDLEDERLVRSDSGKAIPCCS